MKKLKNNFDTITKGKKMKNKFMGSIPDMVVDFNKRFMSILKQNAGKHDLTVSKFKFDQYGGMDEVKVYLFDPKAKERCVINIRFVKNYGGFSVRRDELNELYHNPNKKFYKFLEDVLIGDNSFAGLEREYLKFATRYL